MDDWEPLYVAVQEENRENGTDHQLPCARWQKEECGGRLITGAPMGKEHADDANGGQRRERPPPAKSPWQHQEQGKQQVRSEEHTSELQSLMRISYAVFCLKKKKH